MMASPVEKIETISPPAYHGTLELQPEVAKVKSANRKYVIVGVTAMVVVAMVIAGVLAGVYLQNQHTESVVKHVREFVLDTKDNNGKDTKSKLRIDADNNEKDMSSNKVHVHDDYNRGISTIKTEDKDGNLVCFLKPLNKTGVTEPKAMKDYLSQLKKSDFQDEGDDDDDDDVEKVRVAGDPLDNISFLSHRAQIMCANLKTHWLIPSNEKRDKRQVCRYRRLFWYTHCCHCHYISGRRRWICGRHTHWVVRCYY